MSKMWAKMPFRSYRFSDTEAKTFLQGQLTQDINTLSPSQCAYAAYCNAKGRMFATLLLTTDDSGDDIIVRLHQNQAEAVIKRLQLFILRSAVQISPLSVQHFMLNQEAAIALCQYLQVDLPNVFYSIRGEGLTLCALPNDYYEVAVTDDSPLLGQVTAGEEAKDALEKHRLAGGHFHILPETSESILPQHTPMATWGISYTKGCYVGQEIIARNKYLGTVKKCLAFAEATTAGEHIDLLTPILTQDGASVGKLIEYGMDEQDGKGLYLAVLSIANLSETVYVNEQPLIFEPVATSE